MLLYAGLGALMDDPNVTLARPSGALLPTAVVYDVVLSAFVVPGVLAVAGRVEPEPTPSPELRASTRALAGVTSRGPG